MRMTLFARRHPRAARRQRGAFLIEGLIAIAVFSIGITAVLGIVGKMVVASSDAQSRVQAAQLAESLSSEIRTAATSTRVASYQTQVGAATPYGVWLNRVTAKLPLSGTAASVKALDVAFTGTDNLTVTITINWRAPQDTAKGTSGIQHNYVTQTYLGS